MSLSSPLIPSSDLEPDSFVVVIQVCELRQETQADPKPASSSAPPFLSFPSRPVMKRERSKLFSAASYEPTPSPPDSGRAWFCGVKMLGGGDQWVWSTRQLLQESPGVCVVTPGS